MRYAIYHTPERSHNLTKAAARWLGRDAFGGPVAEPFEPADWTQAEHKDLVADAARYGFHATLKAPFALAARRSAEELCEALRKLNFGSGGLVIQSLELCQIDGFFALVPSVAADPIQEFAALIVQRFDEFRAPLERAEVMRRNPEKLSARQRDYLENWGYPYVFEEFFFHMTLTGRIATDKAGLVRTALEMHFAGFIGAPHEISHVALFAETAPGADFTVQSIRRIAAQSPVSQEG